MAFNFFHVDRIAKQIEELKSLRYKDHYQLKDFIATPEDGQKVNPSPLVADTNSFKLSIGHTYAGVNQYLWINKSISLPKEWAGKELVGVFDFGLTDHGMVSGFESLLYVNGKAVQGVDSNHREVFFDTTKLGLDFQVDFRLWTGMDKGGTLDKVEHEIKTAFIALLDPSCDDLYYTGKMIIESIRVLDEHDYNKHQLEKLMIATMQLVDFTNSRSAEFYHSVQVANTYLKTELAKMEKTSPITVNCLGHTHIDLAWLWQLKHTREKLARSFTTVNSLMERYDEYQFLQTQAQLYDYIKEDFPDIFAMMKERIKEGRWEPSGSMWVEADCNLISGESLVRQILYGKKFFKDEFDYDNNFLWLPDVFGYSWALPQILKKANIKTFITTKISWNEYNRIPYDTFMWRGIDGSEILTHFITTPEPSRDTWFYTYNGQVLPSTMKGIWENYANKDLNSDLLLAYGYGDGGGGVNRDMLEFKRRIEKIPGLPHAPSSLATPYLDRLNETFNDKNNTGYRHVWDNELYLEFHRGTYTSQAYNKYMNRFLEIEYREIEFLQTMAAISAHSFDNYMNQELNEGWKIILRNQFHDIIPGSSIHEVYEDSRVEYSDACRLATRIKDQAFQELLKQEDRDNTKTKASILLANSSSWTRSGLVSLPSHAPRDGYYTDPKGNKFILQDTKTEPVLYFTDLEPLSFTSLSYHEKDKAKAKPSDCEIQQAPSKKEEEKPSNFKLLPQGVESRHYAITWNAYGHLTSIIDKRSHRNILTGDGNLLQLFEDKPRMYDAWEIECSLDLKTDLITDFYGASLTEEGPHFIKILFQWKYNKTTIDQHLVLYHHSHRIDFETRVDWQEREKFMKVAFPVDVRSTTARYDIQFGNVERSTHNSTSWDFAKFEVVGHQWADLSEKGFGVALLNNGKYGYDIKNNVMRLSLLKAANHPDPLADKGIHHFTYALLVHEEEWYKCQLLQEAWDLNNPMKAISGNMATCKPYIDLLKENCLIDAIKKSEYDNRIIVRLHEPYGGKASTDMKLNFPHKHWYEVDLMENPITEPSTANIQLQLRPYDLRSIAIEL
jgi:alpha-mannosidase